MPADPSFIVGIYSESQCAADYAVITLCSENRKELSLRRAAAAMLNLQDSRFTELCYSEFSCIWLTAASAEPILRRLTTAASNRLECGEAVVLPNRAPLDGLDGIHVEYSEVHVTDTSMYFTSYPRYSEFDQTTDRIDYTLIDKVLARFFKEKARL